MAAGPSAELVTANPDPPIPDLVNNILGGKQYVSPSYWLGWAASEVCGVNPWDWLAQQFAGDWNAAAVASEALKHLAGFNISYSGAITTSTKDVIPADWTGNAAAAADEYFRSLAETLTAQVEALEGMARQFHSVAAGMQEMAQALQSLFQDLLDWLIVIGISAAATAASSWTVIGGIVGGIGTAASIAEAAKVWYMILDAHDAAWAAVQAFTGVVAGYLGALQGLKKHPLPATAYNHPGV